MVKRCGIVVVSMWLAAAATQAQFGGRPNTLSFEEGEEGWMLLFYGKDIENWILSAAADWHVREGEITVTSGEMSLLMTDEDYRDFELKVDFLADPGTNSGIFFRVAAAGGGDHYELNIAPPDHAFPTGSVVRLNLDSATPTLGLTARYEAAGEADDWRTFHLIVEGGRIEVKLDDETIVELEDSDPVGNGRIALQHNQGRVAFRNVKVRRLAW